MKPWPFQAAKPAAVPADVAAAITKRNRLQGRINKAQGLHAEEMVIAALLRMGIDCEHLETAWRIKRVAGKIVGATPKKNGLADLVGVRSPDGRAVLIEVKKENGQALNWSRVTDDQRANLSRWHSRGAICYVAWVSGLRARLIPWPCDPTAWRFGHSIEWTHPSTIQLV